MSFCTNQRTFTLLYVIVAYSYFHPQIQRDESWTVTILIKRANEQYLHCAVCYFVRAHKYLFSLSLELSEPEKTVDISWYWWRVTTQIWLVLMIGRKFPSTNRLFSQARNVTIPMKAIERSHYVTLPWHQFFWMTTKPIKSLKSFFCTISNFTDLIQFHIIWQILAKSSLGPYLSLSKFRKRKRQFLCCVHLLHKVGSWN